MGVANTPKLLFAVLALSAATHLAFFNTPNEVVFDEVHFGTFVRSYITGERHFDIHPPLGKIIIAGIAKLGGANLSSDLTLIGQQYPAKDLFLLRLFPLLAGIFLPVVFFLIALEITRSKFTAFLVGLFFVFENALLVQSRFAFLDIPLLFFGFSALLILLKQERASNRKTKILLLFFAAILFGASYAIKWTALAIVVPFGIVMLFSLWHNRSIKWFAAKISVLFIVSLALYATSFAAHFSLSSNPGPGDIYLSREFWTKPFFQKFILLNKSMYEYNKNINAEHPYSSSWNELAINKKPIYYWMGSPTQVRDKYTETAYGSSRIAKQIWLAGNPFIWMIGLFSVAAGFVLLFLKLLFRKSNLPPAFPIAVLLSGWVASYLPFALIERPLFLYHYFFPLAFSLLISGCLIQWIISKKPLKKYTAPFVSAILLFAIAGFLAIAPVSYGINFTQNGLYQNIILKHLISL
ncbi:MAG: hypothetical protein A3B96_00075 [Candidatus Spechtbacteria bacterium RIFCSPHIGHO2_02_FULL_43_15b]|uniref:Polyprenol-phosphate-mannose--protein mannosyltransferase n=1 Tax=Candidatus Spechtbacteria bacterium RIFCSPHIGHO2_01_FULL_43_30 TaxID=1802158 RepID=A0A1G2H716_9BACT|nr:MAG: hypothetical protein A2827_02525 [Candidatus Spechtbacteria bacterium RIFCSPHIGHO2_01_FULL_43_30]OGZ60339.1 MAG: hypothetical protein A3B96_00075 [Candidatus Spechtbacteria bacterium RIFCSPHIGHO2_02_FULL_43_15b]